MRTGLFSGLILLFGYTTCFSQQQQQFDQEHALAIAKSEFKARRVIPPSPEAADLGKYGNTPVSLFTGTPKINIPLMELKGVGTSMAVGVSFSASGFKPQEIAGWVGLGWSLNAGGVITRSVMANPDNTSNYFKPNYDYTSLPPINNLFANYDYMRAIQMGTNEAQPDIYYYNFGNQSGKFLLKPDQSVVKKEKNNLRVTHCITCASPSFTIVDESGTTYEFNEVEISTTTIDDATTEIPTPISYSFPSSWYLSKITSADGMETIEFTYHTIAGVHTQFSDYVANGSKSYSRKVGGTTQTWSVTETTSSPPVVTVKKKYLQRAQLKRGGIVIAYVDFESGEDLRQDISHLNYPGERLLQSVKLFTRNQQQQYSLVRQQNLVYGYFSSANSKRLRLEQVQEVPVDANTTQKPPHIFEYFALPNVPALGNSPIDHWGFLNGDGSNFVTTLVPTVVIGGQSFGSGANREPYLPGSLFGTISKIKYPTGGYSLFEFELNRAFDSETNSERAVGGIRIKRITDYSFEGKKAIVKNYEYLLDNNTTSGKSFFPVYYSSSSYHFYAPPILNPPPTYGDYDMEYINVSASSVAGLGSIQGSHIGYAQVTEYQTDVTNDIPLGKTVYKYQVSIVDGTDDDISNGDLLEQSVYDKEGKLLTQQVNTYVTANLGAISSYKITTSADQDNRSTLCKYTLNGNIIYEWKLAELTDPVCQSSRVYKSKIIYVGSVVKLQNKQLTQTLTKQYDQLSGNYITSIKNFAYENSAHNLPTKIEEKSMGAEWVVTRKKYPLDYTVSSIANNDNFTAGIKQLQDHNIIGAEIESVQYRQNQDGSNQRVINGLLTQYATGFPNPILVYRLELNSAITNFQLSSTSNGVFSKDSRYKELGVFAYDGNNNLAQQAKFQDAPKAYVWDYYSSLPVAEVNNARASDIAYTSFESENSDSWTFSPSYQNSSRIVGGITGKVAYSLLSGTTISKAGLDATRRYVVSYWSKNGALSVNSSAGAASAISIVTQGVWTLYEHNLPEGAISTSIAGTAHIDELRLFPTDAHMTTLTYDNNVGVTSQSAPNGQIVYFQYDGYHRLVNVLDDEGNIVQNYKYNYGLGNALTPSAQTLYYSAVKTGTYTKNNCVGGGEPTSVTYTVPYGRYVSSQTQAAADAKAVTDVQDNGQAYANQNGECRFYNTAQQSEPVQRNNCRESGYDNPTPEMGGFILFVPARAFYSLVDVPDADSKALTFINNNKQQHANSQPYHLACTCWEKGKKYIPGYNCVDGVKTYIGVAYQKPNGSWYCKYIYSYNGEPDNTKEYEELTTPFSTCAEQ